MRDSRRQQGYTLLEVLLVMAVIAILAAIAMPSVESLYRNTRMTAAIDQVRGQFSEARARSIDDGVSYRFAIIHGQNRFRIAPDIAEFWNGGDASDLIENAWIHEDELPQKVTFSAPNMGSSSEWQPVVVFLPTGECKEDAELLLTAPGHRSVVLRIRGLTGVITTQYQDQGAR